MIVIFIFKIYETTNKFLSFKSLYFVFNLTSLICEILKAPQFQTNITSFPLYGVTRGILLGLFGLRVLSAYIERGMFVFI